MSLVYLRVSLVPLEVLKKKLAESQNIDKFWASSWGKKLKTQVSLAWPALVVYQTSNCQYDSVRTSKGRYGKIREVKSPKLLEWNDLWTNT